MTNENINSQLPMPVSFRIPYCTLFQFLLIVFFSANCNRKTAVAGTGGKNVSKVEFWLTNADASVFFQKQSPELTFGSVLASNNPTIKVDDTQTYQTIDGFGFCLTGGSAMLIRKMTAEARKALLTELFTTNGNNIGTSYIRISIGASDLDDHVFSYDDLPAGETDPQLTKFSLAPDQQYLIPVLKEIIALNPKLKILASPWSAPTWMKTNGDTKGGSLKPDYYDTYAAYFVKYLQAMKGQGIPIDALTIQNEPLHPGNNPSMYMPAEAQTLFIKNSLGPALNKANLSTKIIVYDHNADRPDYPLTVYNDAAARSYVDGAAFHLYAGKIDTLSAVHAAYPQKNLYFTEQWVGGPGNLKEDIAWHVRTLIIGGTRNWCRAVLEWNLASDPNYNPHTDRGGCDRCLGAVTIDGNKVTRNPAYYIIAHAAKFIRPGSVRIESNLAGSLYNAAFKTENGKTILVVQNNNPATQSFQINYRGKQLATSLPSEAVGTYIW